jgi:hypothetical protein
MAQIGSYAITICAARSPSTPCSPPRTCPSTFDSIRPESRSSSDSPTHMIGVIPAAKTAFAFLFTVSSVSPKNCRRSECPTITCEHCSAWSMPGATSPVNAPLDSQCTFWAPSPNGSRSDWITVCTDRSAVNGGQITTSTRSVSSLLTR